MGKYKVVIVDDEPWTREVIKALGEWEELGLEVVGEASDGEYGLELIRQTTPDIIITDVKMPHRNGIDLIGTLRSNFISIGVIRTQRALQPQPGRQSVLIYRFLWEREEKTTVIGIQPLFQCMNSWE
jgi:Response regulator containing CheY-like receiver domain and AraC-type DNA-binding domain